MRRPLRAIVVAAAVAVAVLAAGMPGCKKESESLIFVNVQATDTSGAGQSSLEITVSEPPPSTKTIRRVLFGLSMPPGLPMSAPVPLGVYIPAGVTGTLPVKVVASPPTGCNGYTGRMSAKVNPGGTVTVTIMMGPEDICMLTGMAGSGGSTGAAGAGGNAGTAGTTGAGGSTTSGCPIAVGTPPPPVAPPSFANCVEYNHNGAGLVCNPSSGDIDNPYINDLVVSPDGQLLATAAADSYGDGSVKFWRLQGNTPVACGPTYSSIAGPPFVAFSPDGQYLAIAWQHGYVNVYRLPALTFVAEIKSSAHLLVGVAFSPDSQTVFSLENDGYGAATLFADRVTGAAITTLPLPTLDAVSLAVSPVAVGGSVSIAMGALGGAAAVYTWNGTTFAGPTSLTTAVNAEAWAVEYSPNGQLLAIGSSDGVVRFFSVPVTSNTPSGVSIAVGANVNPWQVSFSPNGSAISIAFGNEIDLWNVSTRAFVSRYAFTPPAGSNETKAYAVSFSASGGAVIGGAQVCGRFVVCGD
jgi:hypothetical protein